MYVGDGAIKYLVKNTLNGHDRLTINLKANKELAYNKVNNYQECRYLEAPGATNSMLEIYIIEAKATVERLEFHLPNRQLIYLSE